MSGASRPVALRVPVGGDTWLRVCRWDGPPGRPDLVLVHGFLGSAEAWGDLPRRLAARRTVIVPELPGHGGSDALRDPEAYRVPRLAEAVSRAVEGASGPHAGRGDRDWLGYSMGGRVVLAGVVEGCIQPRRLVLESASPGLDDAADRARRRAEDERRARRLEEDGLEAFVDAWLNLPLFASQRRLPSAVREAERRRRLVHDPLALAACLRGGGTGSQPSYWDRLGAACSPTVLVTGGLDAKFDAIADAMAARMPRAARCRVADAGHAVHLEDPEAWMATTDEEV